MNRSSGNARCPHHRQDSHREPATAGVTREGDRLSSRVERLAGSRLSRRSTLAATALGLLTPLLGEETLAAKRHAFDAAASAPPPLPSTSGPGDRYVLPPCSPGVDHYCVESVTQDGVAIPPYASAPDPPNWDASLISRSPDGGPVDQFAIAIGYPFPPEGNAYLSKTVVARIRLGLFEPGMSLGYADGFELNVSGDATSGFLLEARGRPASFPLTDGNPEQAARVDPYFNCNSFRAGSDFNEVIGLDGFVAGSNILGLGFPTWLGNGWSVNADSPHLMPDGSVTHGSYRSWLSSAALQRLGLSASEAVAGGLVVTRTDDGVESPISATLSELNGGALIDVPDLTFSHPTISIVRGACATKCKKGHICKNGRCVKKKKKHHKKKHH